MRTPFGIVILISFMLLLDTYVFQAVRTISHAASPKTRTVIYSIYWGFTIISVIGILLFLLTGPDFMPRRLRTYLFATIIGLFFAKMIAAVFFLVDDVRRLIQWVASKVFFNNTEGEELSSDGISRSVFLSWLGVAAGSTLFGSLLYGF